MHQFSQKNTHLASGSCIKNVLIRPNKIAKLVPDEVDDRPMWRPVFGNCFQVQPSHVGHDARGCDYYDSHDDDDCLRSRSSRTV